MNVPNVATSVDNQCPLFGDMCSAIVIWRVCIRYCQRIIRVCGVCNAAVICGEC